MGKARLEAFSDGVIAILITIMVLELKPPEGGTLVQLIPLSSVILSYTLSFVFLANYWNNHHHTLQSLTRVTSPVLWANHHLLFWLSLVPFTTAWMGANYRDAGPTVVYGSVLMAAAIASRLLRLAIIRSEGTPESAFLVTGDRLRGHISLAGYLLALPLAFVRPWISQFIYVVLVSLWFFPNPRAGNSDGGRSVPQIS